MCNIPHAVKIYKLVQLMSQGVKNLLAIMAAEQQLRGTSKGVGSFSLPEDLETANHHLHCLAYISERRSQRSTLLAICADTLAQMQSDECIHVMFPSISKYFCSLFSKLCVGIGYLFEQLRDLFVESKANPEQK